MEELVGRNIFRVMAAKFAALLKDVHSVEHIKRKPV